MIRVDKDGKVLMTGSEGELEKEIVCLAAIYLHDCACAHGRDVLDTAAKMFSTAVGMSMDNDLFEGGVATTIRLPKFKEREGEDE